MITRDQITQSLQTISESASEFKTSLKQNNGLRCDLTETETEGFFTNSLERFGFKVMDENRQAVSKIAKNTFMSEKLRGYLLQGDYDTGKTFFSKIYVNIINSIKEKSAIYFTANDISRFFRNEKMVINGNEFGLEYLWKYKIIIVDDIGTESSEVQCFGTKLQPITEMIHQRYDKNLSIWITTNIDQVSFAKIYGERITSRLKEMSYAVIFKGKDLFRGK